LLDVDSELYTSTSYAKTLVGPVKVANISGKGRGLIATQHLNIGDLILACQPLAITHGNPEDEEAPDYATLYPKVKTLASAAQPQPHGSRPSPVQYARQWLHVLHDGRPSEALSSDSATSYTDALFHASGMPVHVPNGPASDAAASTPRGLPPLLEARKPDLEQLVLHNAFGDGFDDLVAVAVRKAAAAATASSTAGSTAAPEPAPSSQATSHVGLWPHFSLLNHSCLPNAVHYVVGSTMVVRAVHPIAPGDEVLVSYLGREDFAPAQSRQQVLQQRFGFHCTCPRCSLESLLPPSTTSTLAELYSDVQHRLAPQFNEAVMVKDMAGVEQVGQQLASWSERLFPTLESLISSDLALNFTPYDSLAAGPSQQQQGQQQGQQEAEGGPSSHVPAWGGPQHAGLCVEATVYGYFELLYMYDEVTEKNSTATLRLCMQIMDAVSRGSELHTFQAAQLLFRALESPDEQEEGSPESAAAAALACDLAHQARYGHVSPQLKAQLFRQSTLMGQMFL